MMSGWTSVMAVALPAISAVVVVEEQEDIVVEFVLFCFV